MTFCGLDLLGAKDFAPLTDCVDRGRRFARGELLGAELIEAPSLDAVRAGRAVIKRHMRGAPVSYVQRALRLYGVVEDGVFTSDVEAAVRKLQEDYGLSVDGAVGKKTMAVLDNPGAFKPVADKKADRPRPPSQQPQWMPASGDVASPETALVPRTSDLTVPQGKPTRAGTYVVYGLGAAVLGLFGYAGWKWLT